MKKPQKCSKCPKIQGIYMLVFTDQPCKKLSHKGFIKQYRALGAHLRTAVTSYATVIIDFYLFLFKAYTLLGAYLDAAFAQVALIMVRSRGRMEAVSHKRQKVGIDKAVSGYPVQASSLWFFKITYHEPIYRRAFNLDIFHVG